MTYKFASYENKELVKHFFETLEEAETFVNEKIEKFKKVNRVRDEEKDKSFQRYKNEWLDNLQQQKNDNERLSKMLKMSS